MGKTNEIFSPLHYEKVHGKAERMNANTRFPGRVFFVDVGNLRNDVIDIFPSEIVTEYKEADTSVRAKISADGVHHTLDRTAIAEAVPIF